MNLYIRWWSTVKMENCRCPCVGKNLRLRALSRDLRCVFTSYIQFVYSHVDDVIRQVQAFIMEHNVRTYDVGNMSDVYQLSVFIQALAERGEKLTAKFLQDYLPPFLERVHEDPGILKWSKLSEMPRDKKKSAEKEKIATALRR